MEEAHKMIFPFVYNNKFISSNVIHEEIPLKEQYCATYIQPLRLIALGEWRNQSNPNQRAIIKLIDPKMKQKCKSIDLYPIVF